MDKKESSHGFKKIPKPHPDKYMQTERAFSLRADMETAEIQPKVQFVKFVLDGNLLRKHDFWPSSWFLARDSSAVKDPHAVTLSDLLTRFSEQYQNRILKDLEGWKRKADKICIYYRHKHLFRIRSLNKTLLFWCSSNSLIYYTITPRNKDVYIACRWYHDITDLLSQYFVAGRNTKQQHVENQFINNVT